MKSKIIIALCIIFSLGFGTTLTAQKSKEVYTCVMPPEVQKDKPGTCPKCGMTLEKKTILVVKAKSAPTKKPSSKRDTVPSMKTPDDAPVKQTGSHMHQQHMNMVDTTKEHKQPSNTTDVHHMQMGDMDTTMPMSHHMNMSHSYSLNLPMNRNGSGTGWLPDASPMYGYMFHTPTWMYMLHGNFFLRYNNQDLTNKGTRGDTKIDAPDWLMFMGQRQVGKNGLFHFSIMSSLDAPLGGSDGYPLLFQSGEAYKSKSIVDRQHPHDLFSELSGSYAQALSPKTDVFAYFGYPGEPALGPVAFMHRPSALSNPDAPITHHWVDATHVTFGVATIGVRYGQFKLEGSSFTGREPDENRYDFDKPRFDSWSGRLSFSPSNYWTLQLSQGFIKSPELLHPNEDVNRTTASAIYSKQFSNNSMFSATAVWGMNKLKDHKGENAVLLEGEWRRNKLAIHSRYEFVQKGIEELALDENAFAHDAVFPVNAFTLGFNYDLLKIGQTRLAGGGQWTWYHADKRLDNLYGKNPMAVEVYLRLYPSMMKMSMKN